MKVYNCFFCNCLRCNHKYSCEHREFLSCLDCNNKKTIKNCEFFDEKIPKNKSKNRIEQYAYEFLEGVKALEMAENSDFEEKIRQNINEIIKNLNELAEKGKLRGLFVITDVENEGLHNIFAGLDIFILYTYLDVCKQSIIDMLASGEWP